MKEVRAWISYKYAPTDYVLMYHKQDSRVAAAFGVTQPLYLVKESDNTAIFPKDTTGGLFSSSFTVGARYDVYGSNGSGSSASSGIPSTPFGAFTRYAA